ncbi:MAG TPA: ATP-dependent Clp protease adapter ClpS [Alcaligenaceae bacterium]|nr:ATP-dependent Clp protease adapter ClpS [Alcaligenaceae bacterium]
MSANTTVDKEKLKAELATTTQPPPLYQVIMLNDDFTTMEFVVAVLTSVFRKSAAEAEHIMLTIHYQGRGICGVYPKDIAATRIQQVHHLAELEQHPLKCVMEPVP